MGLKSFFGKLFGSVDEAPKVTETVEYAGYVIVAQPKPQGGQFYTAGTISKEFPDGTREQHFIRAEHAQQCGFGRRARDYQGASNHR